MKLKDVRQLRLSGFIFSAFFTLLLCAGHLSAQHPFDLDSKNAVLDSISSRWEEWETAGISGKLRMNGLPISPGVKIFMQRDSCISISLRAPLMGEIARGEIAGDTLLLVNKMGKTYVKESLAQVLANYPGSISDIQNLLLGRPVFPGIGLPSSQNAGDLEIFRESDTQYSMVPADSCGIEGFSYGYLFNDDWTPEALLVLPLAKEETVVAVSYQFTPGGYDITVTYENPEKNKSGTLQLDYPQWDASPISPVKINKSFRQLDFPAFMKSF